MGQVLLYHGNLQGTSLCAEGFNQLTANVICQEMEYENAEILLPTIFGRAHYRTFTLNVQCLGTERSIQECPQETGYCRYRAAASLMCYNGTLSKGWYTVQN